MFNFIKDKISEREIKRRVDQGVEDRLHSIVSSYSPFPGYNGFDGEKGLNVLGLEDTIEYDVDYYTMANRAQNLYNKNKFAKSLISKIVKFTIKTGFKAQPIPKAFFLQTKYNITINEDSIKMIEAYWDLFSNSKECSYNKEDDLSDLQAKLLTSTLLNGDCLVVRRFDQDTNLPNYQLVDGRNVIGDGENPTTVSDDFSWIDGVKISTSNGEHLSYSILQDDGTYREVAAKAQNGERQAWLVYANKDKVDSVRGLSSLSQTIQTINQIEKYSENEVIASNTNAKIAATIEHDENSSGKNPMPGRSKVLSKLSGGCDAGYEDGEKRQTKLSKLTGGIIMNMFQGQKLKSFDTQRPNVNYENFEKAVINSVASSMDVPPEVLRMMFTSSYSASRAALKIFEVCTNIWKKKILVDPFAKRIYSDWLEINLLTQNLQFPGFENVINNRMDFAAITAIRFISQPIPHIDPTKETTAIIDKVDNNLMTRQQATEELGTGDWEDVIEKIKQENELLPEQPIAQQPDNQDDE